MGTNADLIFRLAIAELVDASARLSDPTETEVVPSHMDDAGVLHLRTVRMVRGPRADAQVAAIEAAIAALLAASHGEPRPPRGANAQLRVLLPTPTTLLGRE